MGKRIYKYTLLSSVRLKSPTNTTVKDLKFGYFLFHQLAIFIRCVAEKDAVRNGALNTFKKHILPIGFLSKRRDTFL